MTVALKSGAMGNIIDVRAGKRGRSLHEHDTAYTRLNARRASKPRMWPNNGMPRTALRAAADAER